MNNTMFVKTPSFVVNANGRLSESLRADETKGQRKLTVEKRNFESLKMALSWINKESQKKSTVLYLYEIRPAAHGAYDVRAAIGTVKQPAKKVAPKTTNIVATAKTVANPTTSTTNTTSNNANTPRRTAVKK